jgi:hypothetical protein
MIIYIKKKNKERYGFFLNLKLYISNKTHDFMTESTHNNIKKKPELNKERKEKKKASLKEIRNQLLFPFCFSIELHVL